MRSRILKVIDVATDVTIVKINLNTFRNFFMWIMCFMLHSEINTLITYKLIFIYSTYIWNWATATQPLTRFS